MAPPENPHDALFRKTFSNPQHAAAELRAVLSPELLAQIDLSTLQPASGSYVDAELESTQSDLLFSVETPGVRMPSGAHYRAGTPSSKS